MALSGFPAKPSRAKDSGHASPCLTLRMPDGTTLFEGDLSDLKRSVHCGVLSGQGSALLRPQGK